ncbi:hypothetical protein NP233_g9639 [Leucocoprinus birnbaumii]|uniref:DNA 3'-5' helicase n=1 Tax=Leucocoprinus birnbaumii TaxID=56174 RepID=A0AAD5VK22_9AGAR|nr:hypothetical protein NP233_g9639 [Leucocoprinus birnbaumii]
MPSKYSLPTEDQIRRDVIARFGVKPCLYQIRDALAQLRGEDVITIAATGSGKTLTFWIPLLYIEDDFIFLITALNILGDQNVKELQAAGFSAINLLPENCKDEIYEKIERGDYQVIIVSPERLLTDDRLKKILENKKFQARLFNVLIDEGHCVSQWGAEFCPEYADLGCLQWLFPDHAHLHVVSATMPKQILMDVKTKLQMKGVNTMIRRSNNHKNIYLAVEEMKHPAAGLLNLWRYLALDSGVKPPKFMVFTKTRLDTERIAQELWKDLPKEKVPKETLIWFHVGMSSHFKAEAIQKLRDGNVWGLICTDAAGMGLDIPDVELIIQWGYIDSLCTLVQHIGRGARGEGKIAVGFGEGGNDDELDDDDDMDLNEALSVNSATQPPSQAMPDEADVPSETLKDAQCIPFPKSRNKSVAEYEADVMDVNKLELSAVVSEFPAHWQVRRFEEDDSNFQVEFSYSFNPFTVTAHNSTPPYYPHPPNILVSITFDLVPSNASNPILSYPIMCSPYHSNALHAVSITTPIYISTAARSPASISCSTSSLAAVIITAVFLPFFTLSIPISI